MAENTEELPVCFILMPISDPEGYSPGHFKLVYENIFKPACNIAGYRAIRADDVAQTNLIQLDILQKLLDAPMVLCDLSAHNPNTLFELGIRQAFDKPVVLVQEIGTQPIFDISPMRYTQYRSDQKYQDVLEDQKEIAAAIVSTKEEFEKGLGVNSIVKLLSLAKSATVAEPGEEPLLNLVHTEILALRQDVKASIDEVQKQVDRIAGRIVEPPEFSRLSRLPSLTAHDQKWRRSGIKPAASLNVDDLTSPDDEDIPF